MIQQFPKYDPTKHEKKDDPVAGDSRGAGLLRPWLVDSLPQYSYFSLGVELPNDEKDLLVF